MSGSPAPKGSKGARRGRLVRRWGLTLCVVAVYLALLVAVPDSAIAALKSSARVLVQIALPLCVAFAVLFLINLLVKPRHIARYLGRRAGVKGVALSTLAGILSMGPIYAWYPLLRDLREKGASDFHLANFLSNRAVKPFLLPVMVFYFGWPFTATLSVLMVLGALVVALAVSALARTSRVPGEQA